MTVAYSGSLSTNATDPESNPLTFAKTGGAAWLSVASNGALTGTPNVLGLNTATVTVSDGTNAAVAVTVQITITEDPYIIWKTTNNVISDTADDDNDGITNLMEFALGGNPKIGDSGVRTPEIIRNGQSFDFKFDRSQSVIYTIEKSTDLVTWTLYARQSWTCRARSYRERA
jgi:hypothetical protein